LNFESGGGQIHGSRGAGADFFAVEAHGDGVGDLVGAVGAGHQITACPGIALGDGLGLGGDPDSFFADGLDRLAEMDGQGVVAFGKV